MSLGLLNGSPNTYLSQGWYATGDRLAQWIELEIPSFVGNVPVKYTEALLAIFRKHHVPDAIMRHAFLKLKRKGTQFDGMNVLDPHPTVAPQPLPNSLYDRWGGPAASQIRFGISKAESLRQDRYTFDEYERKYVQAMKTNDFNGAEAIIAAVLQLLWGTAKGYGKMKQAARNEKMVEWEEFNEAVNQALARAVTLRTHISTLSPKDRVEFRNAATPDKAGIIAFGMARRLVDRNTPRARRVRSR